MVRALSVNTGLFQSTRPWEGATILASFVGETVGFQSTRPWEGATLLSRGIQTV